MYNVYRIDASSPGHRNVKPKTLSRLFGVKPAEVDAEIQRRGFYEDGLFHFFVPSIDPVPRNAVPFIVGEYDDYTPAVFARGVEADFDMRLMDGPTVFGSDRLATLRAGPPHRHYLQEWHYILRHCHVEVGQARYVPRVVDHALWLFPVS